MIQNSIYKGYSMMPGPNDPGIIIRTPSQPGQIPIIIGHAPDYYGAQTFIDNYIAGQAPPTDPPVKK